LSKGVALHDGGDKHITVFADKSLAYDLSNGIEGFINTGGEDLDAFAESMRVGRERRATKPLKEGKVDIREHICGKIETAFELIHGVYSAVDEDLAYMDSTYAFPGDSKSD